MRATICSTISAGSGLSPMNSRNQIRPLASAETAHGQRGHVRMAGSGWLELRTKGDQHQDRQPPDALNYKAQQLEHRRVNPVHVLVESQHRLQRRQPARCSTSACNVRRFCTSEVRVSAGYRSTVGTPSSPAISGTTSSSRSMPRARYASSLLSLVAGGSSRAKPVARSSCSIKGCSGLVV